MIALILAGGLGSRLREVVPELPKPLADIQGEPFLAYLLNYLSKFASIQRFILSVGYKGDLIESYFGKTYAGIPIAYVYEKEPLGTGGALQLALKDFPPQDFPVLVINGDTFLEFDLQKLLQLHLKAKLDLSVVLREVPESQRYGVAHLAGEHLLGFQEKMSEGPAWINGGVYLLSSSVQKTLKKVDLEKFSWETEILSRLRHLSLLAGGFKTHGNFIDIGIPEDYKKAQSLLPLWLRERPGS